jgi:alpha-L-rhamnosidase
MVHLFAESLSCEYRSNPLGIGTSLPRLSWQIRSDLRGVRQQAYRLVVAGEDAL